MQPKDCQWLQSTDGHIDMVFTRYGSELYVDQNFKVLGGLTIERGMVTGWKLGRLEQKETIHIQAIPQFPPRFWEDPIYLTKQAVVRHIHNIS